MPTKVGEVAALLRYPVKSMSGDPLDVADLGWHGIDGDRLKAIVKVRYNEAGVYATVTRRGRLAMGQPVFLEPAEFG